MAGRSQESTRVGATYQLAEFLNKNWTTMVGRTNEDVAQQLGYKAANMISMWRTGKTRIPLEKLPDIADLMHLDIAVLMPLWFEQYWGERTDAKPLMTAVFKRVMSMNELSLVEALRTTNPARDPFYTPDMVDAAVAVMMDPAIRKSAVDAGVKKGVVSPRIKITPTETPDKPVKASKAKSGTDKDPDLASA